jgi:hypothetical protein
MVSPQRTHLRSCPAFDGGIDWIFPQARQAFSRLSGTWESRASDTSDLG